MDLTPSRLAIPDFEKVFLNNGQRSEKPMVDISSGRYTSSDNDESALLQQPDNFE